MADYTPDAKEARDDIAADGGPIEFLVYPADNAPADAAQPWMGSPTEREPFPWHALFAPASSKPGETENYTQLAYIAGYELPFDVVEGTQFRTDNRTYSVEAVAVLRLDGVTPILYTCKVAEWART